MSQLVNASLHSCEIHMDILLQQQLSLVLLLCVVKVYGVWYTHTRDIYGPHLVKVENISAWLAIHAF